MAGYIAEFFGYRAEDRRTRAARAAASRACPFLGTKCVKVLSLDRALSGVCAVRQKSEGAPAVICCPNRMYADRYKILRLIARKAFGGDPALCPGKAAVARAKRDNGAVAVFGQGWGGELRLPQRSGTGAYFVDWVLARLDGAGGLAEFTAVEIQTIDTTGSYRNAREALLDGRKVIVADTLGLNWENVSKRIIPQLIYKGQVLQREELCRTGLYFVCPKPVYDRILVRLGGKDSIPRVPPQPASIHFCAYDYLENPDKKAITPLGLLEEHCTAVYKVQEAFSSINLPDGNVYRDAIRKSLYGGGG